MNKIGTALITGASGGIGLEFAKIHASKGGNLILVARSRDKLEKLKVDLEREYKISVEVIVEDLVVIDAASKVFTHTQDLKLDVDILINNAGFGGHGLFHERDLEAEQAMIQLNISTLTSLTHYYLVEMVKRKGGKILNVSSTASFLPGPLQAVYYATKSYVTSFSQAIAEEAAEHNVSVTALCPGPVATGFVDAANLDGVEVFDKAKSAQSVALCGYEAMERGELLAFNEIGLNIMLNWIVPLLPRKLVLKISRKTMEKK